MTSSAAIPVSGDANEDPNEISVLGIAVALLRYRWLIAASTLAFAVIWVARTYTPSRTYTSTATFVLQSRTGTQYSQPELYWIVKHGIRMTGMSAYGPFYSEQQLWSLAAFLHDRPVLAAGGIHDGASVNAEEWAAQAIGCAEPPRLSGYWWQNWPQTFGYVSPLRAYPRSLEEINRATAFSKGPMVASSPGTTPSPIRRPPSPGGPPCAGGRDGRRRAGRPCARPR